MFAGRGDTKVSECIPQQASQIWERNLETRKPVKERIRNAAKQERKRAEIVNHPTVATARCAVRFNIAGQARRLPWGGCHSMRTTCCHRDGGRRYTGPV